MSLRGITLPVMAFIHIHKYTHAHAHTHICQGLPGWAGTRRKLHPLTPMRKKQDSHRQWGPLHGSELSQWWLSEQLSQHTTKVGWLKLQAVPTTDYWSVGRQYMQYLLLRRTRCILYQLPPLLLAILFCRMTNYELLRWLVETPTLSIIIC